ncbi:serine hydrolase [Demequina sp. NBRC 110053]|uniref:serine hydrolase domain-containing protein n=1 Tax=Demequina sp. NBRC 110053 TaxID=1570342 RepID=UPI0009FD4BAC|nr:serine hydrolase domain-containing protein [Demequina sp. NBRC 110053]
MHRDLLETDSWRADLDRAIAEAHFSGVVAVHSGDPHSGGERVLTRTVGWAHRAHQVPVTPDTRFGMASGSKAFTALAAMRLVAGGDLALDAPVRTWLGGDLPLIDDRVTLRHLLTHTSGIGDYLDEEAGGEVTDYVLTLPVHRLVTAEDFLPELDGHPQREAPGETFRYNNGGFMVAALVIERAAGRPFQDVVADEVFARAGLTATAFERSDRLPGDVALGYLEDEGDWTNVLHLPVRGGGDGGAVTSIDDLDAFWRALAGGRIVEPAVVADMTRARHDVPSEGLRYGMGFWRHATGDPWLIEGYDAGVSMRSTFDPATGVTASVLANTAEGAWPVIEVVARLFDA